MSEGKLRHNIRPDSPKGISPLVREQDNSAVHTHHESSGLSNDDKAALRNIERGTVNIATGKIERPVHTERRGGPMNGNVHGQPEPGRRSWSIYPKRP